MFVAKSLNGTPSSDSLRLAVDNNAVYRLTYLRHYHHHHPIEIRVAKLSTFIYRYRYEGLRYTVQLIHITLEEQLLKSQWEILTFPPLSIIKLE
jgi:hypothetical protein